MESGYEQETDGFDDGNCRLSRLICCGASNGPIVDRSLLGRRRKPASSVDLPDDEGHDRPDGTNDGANAWRSHARSALADGTTYAKDVDADAAPVRS